MTVPLQPQWIKPATGGLLSNNRGTATSGADSIPLTVRYANSQATADRAGQLRVTATQTNVTPGTAFQPLQFWDSGWVGAPTTTPIPAGLRDFGCAQFNGRVYICGGIDGAGNVTSNVWSAPLNGGSVGTWRRERNMAVHPGVTTSNLVPSNRYGMGCTAASFTAGVRGAAGQSWLIIYGGVESYGVGSATVASMIAAPIFGDGTLGDWITIAYSGWSNLAYCQLLAVPNQYATAGLVLSGGGGLGGAAISQSWVTLVRNAPFTAQQGADWDIPGGWWQTLPTSGHPQVAGHSLAFDWANGTLLIFRGTSSTLSQNGFYYLGFGIDSTNWVFSVGGSWGAGSAAEAPRNNHGMVYFAAQSNGLSGGSPQSYVYLFGGTSNNTVTDRTVNPMSSVVRGTLTWSGAGVPTAVWNTSAFPLGAAAAGCRTVLGEYSSRSTYGYPPWMDSNFCRITNLGGGNAGSTGLTTVASTTLPSVYVNGSGGAYTTTGGDITAWTSGTGAGLASGDLGTGGSLVNNQDGTQDASFNYGSPGAAKLQAFSDGDQAQMVASFTDRVGGDASPLSYTTFKVGQPPTIGSVVTPTTTAQPTITFSYSSGAGGATQYTWRLQVKQGGTTIYDTGTRYDMTNSAQLIAAPFLAASTAYNAIIDVSSADTLYPGSLVTATNTTPFTTGAFAVQAAPTSPVAAATSSNVGLTWSAAAGATYYRVYYRRTAVGGTWYLLSDNVAGTSYTAMDNVAVGIGYDFAISAANATVVESAKSGTVTGTVPQGAYSAYLHVATLGTTYGLPLQIQGSPAVTKHRAALPQMGFSQAAPITRYSSADYHTITATATLFDTTPATLVSLQGLIDQVEAGGVCFYRDALGGMLTVTFDSDQSTSIKPPYFRDVALKMTETLNTIGPYVTQGSAQGYLTLVGGGKPPLSIDERLL